MRFGLTLARIAILASTVWAANADALALPAPAVSGGIQSGCAAFGGAADGSVSCDGGTVAASYHNGVGIMSGSVDRPIAQSLAQTASSQIVYYFEVLGPSNPSVNIDAHFIASTYATGSYPSVGSSSVTSSVTDLFQIPLYTITACSDTDSQSSCALSGRAASFDVNPMITIAANTLYKVIMVGQASEYFGGTSGFAADPTIVFDPGFNSAGYSLIFSADATPVPLPASAWLLLSGVLGLTLLSRQKATLAA